MSEFEQNVLTYMDAINSNLQDISNDTQQITDDIQTIRNYEVASYNAEINISGDNMIIQQLEEQKTTNMVILFILSLILVYHFIERLFRC